MFKLVIRNLAAFLFDQRHFLSRANLIGHSVNAGKPKAPTKSLQTATDEGQPTDLWTSRARPTFLYVMYAMIVWSIPMGFVAAISPRISKAVIAGMTDYLAALPGELYTLFATGYLGYATLRQWGKVKGSDR